MNKEFLVGAGLGTLIFGSIIALGQYNKEKDRELREKEVENQKLYFGKLTSNQVMELEQDKIELKKVETEYKITKLETEEKVLEFKKIMQDEIQEKAMAAVRDEMRDTFDKWSNKFEDRIDKKVDRVVSRIDDLSDKYGGVKQASASTPSINVVNAPNG